MGKVILDEEKMLQAVRDCRRLADEMEKMIRESKEKNGDVLGSGDITKLSGNQDTHRMDELFDDDLNYVMAGIPQDEGEKAFHSHF